MNYRHIYHAGNVCDVVKHALLSRILQHLGAKNAPFCVLDTHAGAGTYDLSDPKAQKTGESKSGIVQLLNVPAPPELDAYLNAVKQLNTGKNGTIYPGSPLLTRHFLRPQDRLVACELHPGEAKELKRLFRADKQVHIHNRDGYQALTALLPPKKEKRGLVLIDPPFETADEFSRLANAAKICRRRFPQAIVMMWYPIKERPAIWRFHESLIATKIPEILCAEFIHERESRHDRLNGSGFIFLNPPCNFEKIFSAVFKALHKALHMEHQGDCIQCLT